MSTSEKQARVPGGVPAGGEFAEDANGEPDLSHLGGFFATVTGGSESPARRDSDQAGPRDTASQAPAVSAKATAHPAPDDWRPTEYRTSDADYEKYHMAAHDRVESVIDAAAGVNREPLRLELPYTTDEETISRAREISGLMGRVQRDRHDASLIQDPTPGLNGGLRRQAMIGNIIDRFNLDVDATDYDAPSQLIPVVGEKIDVDQQRAYDGIRGLVEINAYFTRKHAHGLRSERQAVKDASSRVWQLTRFRDGNGVEDFYGRPRSLAQAKTRREAYTALRDAKRAYREAAQKARFGQ